MRIFRKLQICRWMSKVEYINKGSLIVTQLSDALIIPLNIFKYIDGKEFIPNGSNDEEISLWSNRMAEHMIENRW